tara:strand:- start:1861 stop:2553 length:693 start_codon:yes stop_codon:yes gene_type:complete
MCVIYIRKKLNDTEAKIESMFDLCETLTHEVKILKINATNPIITQESSMDYYQTTTPEENREISIDYTVDQTIPSNDYPDEESDDDFDDEESEDETYEDDETDGIDIDDYNKDNDEDDKDDEEEDEEDEEEDEEDEKDEEDEQEHDNIEPKIVEINSDTNDININTTKPVKVIDISESNVESELNDVDVDTDYSKMTVKELKQLIVEKGYTADVTKLKRSGLINILKEEI